MTVTRNYSSGAGAMTLQSGIGPSDTTISVDTVAGLPVAYPYALFLDYGDSSEEIVDVTNAVGTTLTIVRGRDGSVAQSHDAGSVIRHGVSARDLRESREHEAATSAHGVTEVVGTTEAQTLDQKTFEPASTDRPAAVFRGGPDTVNEPVADFRDGSDNRWGGVYDREVKALFSGQPLWRLLSEGLASFYSAAASFSLRSSVNAIVATKTTGATGKFLRLLATDGTTEKFTVDADGNVAAQDVSAAGDVSVAGALTGPTVTSLQDTDSTLNASLATKAPLAPTAISSSAITMASGWSLSWADMGKWGPHRYIAMQVTRTGATLVAADGNILDTDICTITNSDLIPSVAAVITAGRGERADASVSLYSDGSINIAQHSGSIGIRSGDVLRFTLNWLEIP